MQDAHASTIAGGLAKTAISVPTWVIATVPWTMDHTLKMVGIVTGLLAAVWWGLSIIKQWREIRRQK